MTAMPDMVVRGGKIVLPDRIVDADLTVASGRIAALGTAPASGAAEVDARGLYVMAGMIDTHVHLRDPGQPHRENFATGTRAAALGGITTVLDMPNSVPPVCSQASWQGKLAAVAPRAYVDFALYGSAGASSIAQIGEQAAAGAVAFKSFMNAPAPNADADTISRCLPTDNVFLNAMREVAKTGLVSVLHAENDAICSCMAKQMLSSFRFDALAHAQSRPAYAEEEAVTRAILLADVAGARISFAHVSSARAIARIRAAKRDGKKVTAEACPHHLLLTEDVLAEVGPYGKINPPLRQEADRAAVWDALLDGTIDFIGTDHSPYDKSAKDAGWPNIWQAPSGSHGIETALRVLLTEAAENRITLPRLTQVVSQRAAQVFGLYPRKGELRVGADADFILVDLDRTGEIDSARLQSVSRDAALLWHGRKTRAEIVATYVRGREVARNGRITGAEGYGRVISPQAAAP
jgi:allantoinase